MSNPATVDMHDVADPTNPISGQGYVEELNRATADVPADETSPGRLDQLRAEGRKPVSARAPRSAH